MQGSGGGCWRQRRRHRPHSLIAVPFLQPWQQIGGAAGVHSCMAAARAEGSDSKELEQACKCAAGLLSVSVLFCKLGAALRTLGVAETDGSRTSGHRQAAGGPAVGLRRCRGEAKLSQTLEEEAQLLRGLHLAQLGLHRRCACRARLLNGTSILK